MVEKIDKPEFRPTHYVQESAAAGDDDEQKKRQQDSSGDEYSGSHAMPGWQKIYSASAGRRYIKIKRSDISQAFFRMTAMQRGISLAEIDIVMRDGRTFRGAHIILAAREDFWTLKKFRMGQPVPVNLIAKEPVLELSIPNETSAPAQEKHAQAARHIEATRLQRFPTNLIIYAIIGLALIALVLIGLMK